MDLDLFYAISRGFSRSANSACDLMGIKYNGLVPSMHKVCIIPTLKQRKPWIIRILYPYTERAFHEYYDKDIFKNWIPPSNHSRVNILS